MLSYNFQAGKLEHLSAANEPSCLLECQSEDVQQMYVDLLDDYLNLILNQDTTGRSAPIAAGVDSLAVIDSVCQTSSQTK